MAFKIPTYDDLLSAKHGDLLTLQRDVERALKETESKNRKAAIEALEAQARELGFSAADLFGGKAASTGKASKGESVARFANPNNPSETWSGRGRSPSWVKAHLDAGGSKEDLAI